MKHDIFSLKGKICVVTGGYQGIGEVVAEYVADAGADIAIFDLSDASGVAERIANEYGVKTASYICDVTNPKMVEDCMNRAAADLGTLDLLFNNAGICMHKGAIELEPAEWRKVIDVNLNGVFYVAQAFARYIIANGKKGNIVNVASMSG